MMVRRGSEDQIPVIKDDFSRNMTLMYPEYSSSLFINRLCDVVLMFHTIPLFYPSYD